MTDDDIRRALSRYADATPWLDPRDGLTARMARRERRRGAAVAGTAATALVVAGTGVLALTREDTRAGLVTAHPPTGTPTASATASPTPSTDPAAPVEVTGRGEYGMRLRVTLASGSVPAGTLVEVRAVAADDDGAVMIGSVNWGDGTPVGGVVGGPLCAPQTSTPDPRVKSPGSHRETFTHSWRTPGTYTVTVSASSQRTCDPNPPPDEHATATFQLTVTAGDERSNGPAEPESRGGPYVTWLEGHNGVYERTAEASFIDADGYVRTVVIDWGDGTRTTVRNDEPCDDDGRRYPADTFLLVREDHRYQELGAMTATFTVTSTGCDGQDRQTRTFRVPVFVESVD